ncbi:MAG TPA: fumarylacetoacetate hydrolase family protein [Acidimicrobiales bacterium]|nr:fumarylacetoacetate hydrolase family protein [Acidimicrobiales bacterium]
MKLAALHRDGGGTALHVAVEGGYVAVDELASGTGASRLSGLADVGALFALGRQARQELRALDTSSARVVGEADARLAPPVTRPEKIICVGLNYADHIAETRGRRPERIVLFAKFPSCLVAHGDPIELPAVTEQLDYEGELGVVIGERAKGVKAADALAYVGGYTIVHDVSARDLQSAEAQWIRGKALDTFAPLGPVVLDADDAPPIGEMRIRTLVNGEVRQDALCDLMLTPVPELIEHISAAITLQPGDIIATGTPAGVGVGMDPPRFLQDGDVVTIELDPIGTLTNAVRAAR